MIITRTPFRISFFGGGSDYPAWYRKYGGLAVGATIDKYCYISCRYLPPFFNYKHRIVYSQIETADSLEEIRHPAVKGVLKTLNVTKGLEIHHDGDLPARSGLGSSSAFTVGLIHALKALEGKFISKRQLAEAAVHIEQNVLKECVGSQDQILAAYGGFNTIEFHPDDTFSVTPVIMTKDRLIDFQKSMMLFFTGFTRIASDIAKKQVEQMEERKAQMLKMNELTQQAISLLQSEDEPFTRFGELLNEYWFFKKNLSAAISNPELDKIYEAGREAGAIGGKLLGAGGGGFMLFIVKPEHQQKVREKLSSLIHVNFRLDFTGSKVVVYEPNNFE